MTTRRGLARVAAALLLAGLSGCVQPGPLGAGRQPDTGQPDANLPGRLTLAARQAGAAPPVFSQSLVPSDTGPVPVLRVRFPDLVFFDSAADVPRPGSRPILDVVTAELRDVRPDARLTVIGHTDAVGGDADNMDLSRRRAANVAAVLLAGGVRPEQVGIAAVGRRQPAASDATDEGRAQNRRVEFLFSRSAAANLAVAATPAEIVQVVGAPSPVPQPAGYAEPAPVQARRASTPPRPRILQPAAAPQVPAPQPTYAPNRLENYQPRTLGPTQSY